VLQYLYSLSDLTFFLVPANNISLVANQIPMLELSIMYAVDGEAKFGAAFQQLATTEPQSSTASYGIGDLFGSLSTSRCEARPLSLPWLLVSDTGSVYLTSSAQYRIIAPAHKGQEQWRQVRVRRNRVLGSRSLHPHQDWCALSHSHVRLNAALVDGINIISTVALVAVIWAVQSNRSCASSLRLPASAPRSTVL